MRTIKNFKNLFRMLKNQNDELIWANVWHDTRKGIPWLADMPGISPGRWAVGYNYLYVMTRILNEWKPVSVLELGLGVSTTLISKYFESMDDHTDAVHIIAEHDHDWITFYGKSHPLSACSVIKKQKLVTKRDGNEKYYTYENLAESIQGHKFQIISVDAPFGGGYKSRTDILELLPDILEKEFVIIMDDVNRIGERNTCLQIKQVLNDHHIKWVDTVYEGATHCCVIASYNNRFFCSL